MVETKQSPLHTVTPLSRYLAMLLFIILPFLGGWVGYTHAPEKIVKNEKIAVIEFPDTSVTGLTDTNSHNQSAISTNYIVVDSLPDTESVTGWKTYRNQEFGFEISFPTSFEITEITHQYPPTSVVSLVNASDETTSIIILPEGGFDYGLNVENISTEPVTLGNVEAKKTIFSEKSFYRELITFASNSLPPMWVSNGHRIEVRVTDKNPLTDQIMSTFKFTEES